MVIEYMSQPVAVTSSLPQGDSASPLTMLALMTGLTNLVLAQAYNACTLVTFLDDRNMIARDAQEAYNLWQAWKSNSERVGLWENDNKTKVVPRRQAYRSQLLKQGFSEHHVASAARVLGIDFTATLGDSNRATQADRIKGASVQLNRIATLPIGMKVKALRATSLVELGGPGPAWSP